MKKISLLLACMATLALTACNDDDNNDNNQVSYDYEQTFNQRSIVDSDITFSQSTLTGELDYGTTLSLSMNVDVKLDESTQTSFSTSKMPLTAYKTNCYKFSSSSISSGLYSIDNLKGYFDPTTGAIWASYSVNSTGRIYGNGNLVFPYATTTLTDAEDESRTTMVTNSLYYFIPAEDGATTTMQITNFHGHGTESIDEELVIFNNLNMSVTAQGYHFWSDKVTNDAGNITITDVDIYIAGQGTTITGGFTVNGYNTTFTGTMFHDEVEVY